MACIGTNIEDLTETVQTLDFAQRAKRVRNKPEVNNIVDEYTVSSENLKFIYQKLFIDTLNLSFTLEIIQSSYSS